VSDHAAAWLASSVLRRWAPATAPATRAGHVRGTLAVWRLSELSTPSSSWSASFAANAVNASTGRTAPGHLDGRIPVIRVRLFAARRPGRRGLG